MIPALVVPVLTRPELLYRMLGSIDAPVEHVIVIDNGNCVSTGAARKSTDQSRRVSVVHMPANLGVAGSWNLGIKAAPFAPWWLIANFDIVWPVGALAEFAAHGTPDALVLSGGSPEWAAFILGENVVRRAGVFDESFVPAYYEDTEYQWRCEALGVPIIRSGVWVHHDNSSTLKAGFMDRNARTYDNNGAYCADKINRGDLTDGRWSLDRRRELTWD